MATLLQVRDTVALYGCIELQQLCHTVNDSPAMVKAMLERLEHMGLVSKVYLEEKENGCGQGCQGSSCQKTTCAPVLYTLNNPTGRKATRLRIPALS